MSDAPDTEAAAPAEGGAKKSALVPMLAAVLVGLGAGGASGALVAGPMLAHRVVPAVDTASLAKQLAGGVKAEVEEPAAEPEKKKEEGGKKEGEKAESAPMLLMDNIVMNPSGSNGSRFLLLSVSYEMKDAASMEKLKSHDAEIRDLVQRVMGKHGIDELIDVKNREIFKKELSKATEEISGKETVKKVFFPQFVIQ
jgi:flagellar FliL protein